MGLYGMKSTQVLFFGSDRYTEVVQQSALNADLVVERATSAEALIPKIQSRAYPIVVAEHAALDLPPCDLLERTRTVPTPVTVIFLLDEAASLAEAHTTLWTREMGLTN